MSLTRRTSTRRLPGACLSSETTTGSTSTPTGHPPSRASHTGVAAPPTTVGWDHWSRKVLVTWILTPTWMTSIMSSTSPDLSWPSQRTSSRNTPTRLLWDLITWVVAGVVDVYLSYPWNRGFTCTVFFDSDRARRDKASSFSLRYIAVGWADLDTLESSGWRCEVQFMRDFRSYSNFSHIHTCGRWIFFYLAMPDFLAVTVGGSPIAITFTSDIANIAYHLTFLAAISYSCIP